LKNVLAASIQPTVMFVCRLRTDHLYIYLYPEKKQVVEYVEHPNLSNIVTSSSSKIC